MMSLLIGSNAKEKASMIKILFFLAFSLALLPISQSFAQLDDSVVVLDTKSGRLVIEFFPNDAPNHVENFINLTESGFYDRTIFHRVIQGFMIQGGDPFTKPGAYDSVSQWGTGGPVYENGTKILIDAEFNDIKHNVGIVSMARSQPPDSAGSQFFIVHEDSNFLDGQYTVFGRLATQDSYETLEKIATLETAANDVPFDWGDGEILKAEVLERSSIPDLLDLGDPERNTQSVETSPTLSENYSSDEFGFSTIFPTGWLVQEPVKTQPGTPDVTSVGPISNGFNPSISISIAESQGKTLEEQIDERKNTLQVAIDTGQLKIISEEFTKIDGKDGHIMIVSSTFTTDTDSLAIKFKETIVLTTEKIYQITYVNSEENFDKDVQLYDETVGSFKTLSEDSIQNGNGCLIATATYGSELAPQVQQLREIRDNVLLNTESGKSFLLSFNQLYYTFSPTIADWERENHLFKRIC